MTSRQWLLLLGLLLLAAITSYLLRSSRPLGQNVGASPSATQVMQDVESPRIGEAYADLTMVVFTDYQCPACRKAHPAMRAAQARDGHVRIVYKEWPIFGERSERAAKIALAAHRQDIYQSVHHALMTSPTLDDRALREAVEQSKGDWQQLQTDLDRHGPAIENQLAQNSLDAFSLGLEGTPAYLIGPLLIEGALTEREFLRAIDEARTQIGVQP